MWAIQHALYKLCNHPAIQYYISIKKNFKQYFMNGKLIKINLVSFILYTGLLKISVHKNVDSDQIELKFGLSGTKYDV